MAWPHELPGGSGPAERGDQAEPVQLLYVGSSADVAALRRSMEAHGVITRSRLSTSVSAVVADRDVPNDHPMLRAARSLGLQVLEPMSAIEALPETGTRSRTPRDDTRNRPAPMLAAALIAVLAVLLMLGAIGSVVQNSEPRSVGVEQMVSGPAGGSLPAPPD